MKRVFLTPIALVLLVGAGCDRQGLAVESQLFPHDSRMQDVRDAAQIKPFVPAKYEEDASNRRSLTEADLFSLHVCQGTRQIFVSERASERTAGLVDAQGAAECVVQLQSALQEVPTTHPAYSEIHAELAWWDNKLLELDPADYRRLNP